MAEILLACQISLSLVLLFAFTGKLLDSTDFSQAITTSGISSKYRRVVAITVMATELILSIGLVYITATALPIIMAATAALFAVFTAWMAYVYYRGLKIRCGCFGTGEDRVGPQSILRNIFLLLISLVGLALSFMIKSPLPSPSFWYLVIVTTAAMSLALIYAFRRARSAMVLSVKKRDQAFDLLRAHEH